MALKKTKRGYQLWWYDADGHFRKRTYRGIDRREAERKEREILALRDRGEPPPDERHAPTFGKFAKIWKAECCPRWKASTLSQYEQVLTSQLLPAFKDRRVSRITESDVMQLIAKLQAAGMSAKRINLVIMVLKQILRMALRRRLIRQDPVIAVRSLPEPDTDVDPFSPGEIKAFLAACPQWWRPYFTVAFWTGARPNELAALKVSNIDDAAGRFRIRAGRYRGVEGTPKTKSSIRDVDMIPVVVTAVATQRAQLAARRLRLGIGAPELGNDYLFVGPDLGFVSINRLREKTWYPALEKAKLRRRTMYQTRHSFASNALAAGEDPSWVARMMGHKNTEILFRVYTRFIPNRTRRDGNALAAHMTQFEASDGVSQDPAAKQG